jgi:hypothetical protein
MGKYVLSFLVTLFAFLINVALCDRSKVKRFLIRNNSSSYEGLSITVAPIFKIVMSAGL